MEIEGRRGENGNFSGSGVKRFLNIFLLVMCFLMIFSLSCVLFDKGAVLVARDVVSVSLHNS